MPTLTSPPSLTALYARAAATTPLHRGGGDLPDSVYELAPQPIDPGHVAGYARVCGFRYGAVLPPTYLHVLAFGLQVALMSERGFPFPLVGLVHVANSITVHRPVTVDEQVSFTVRAANLRPHPAGTQLDLLSEGAVDGQRVWSGRSTYLRRGGRPPGRPAGPKPGNALEPPAGAVSQVRVPADIGRRYAAVSGDRNPIHLSALSAKLFGFPSAIAHGMWLKARTLAMLEGRLPERFTVDVSFKTPVLLPTTVAIGSTRTGAGWTLDVRGVKSGKPHLAGTVSGAS
jgi:acyl dehydratase